MSNRNNYTIETALSSSKEWGVAQAPFSLSPFHNRIRKSCVPYFAGPSTALDKNLRSNNCWLPATRAITLSHISSDSEIFAPNLDYNQELTLAHIASTSQVYDPDIDYDQEVTLEHIVSTSQVYDPNLDSDLLLTLNHIVSTSQVYTPDLDINQEITLERIASTSAIYDPDVRSVQPINLEHIVSTSQVYTPDLDISQEVTLEHIVSTSQVYTPDLDYNQEVTLEHIVSTSQVYTPDLDISQEVTLNHITSQFANTKSTAFNGVSGESQLTVVDNASLSFGADGTVGNEPSFSISGWIKPTDLSSPFGLVSKIATGGSGDEYFFGNLPFVGLTFIIADGAGFTDNYIGQTNITLTADVWQHVVATYDGTRVPGGVKVYVNGVDEVNAAAEAGSYTAMSASSADLVIGRKWAGLETNVGEGFLDEIALFDKELSSAEVLEIYNSGDALNLNTFSATSDIVSWWRMGDKATGTSPNYTIPDQIGSNDATMASFQGDSTSGVVADAVAGGSPPYTPGIDYGLSITLSLIDSTIALYNPTISEAGSSAGISYTEIVSASNPNNTTAMHVGSLYLDARTYATFGVMITDIKGDVGGSYAHAELRRFTDGTSLVQLSNTGTAGPTWRSVTTSSLVVSTADWYDIYISASGNPATSSIRGIYYEY